MPVDTANKRASVIGMALPWLVVFPIPDGLALSTGDREQMVYIYRGEDVLVIPPVPTAPPAGTAVYLYGPAAGFARHIADVPAGPTTGAYGAGRYGAGLYGVGEG